MEMKSRSIFKLNKCFADRICRQTESETNKEKCESKGEVYLFILRPVAPAEKALGFAHSVRVFRVGTRDSWESITWTRCQTARCVCMINVAQHDSHASPWLIHSHASLAFVN